MQESVLELLVAVSGFLCSLVCISFWFGSLIYLSYTWAAKLDRSYQPALKRWADENGWEIVHQKRCKFVSPWMFKISGMQFVYYVAVARKEDLMRIRWAWLRCGGWFLGPKSDKIEVEWDGLWHVLAPPEPTPTQAPQDDLLWDRWADG
jgi:hypothetical protein